MNHQWYLRQQLYLGKAILSEKYDLSANINRQQYV